MYSILYAVLLLVIIAELLCYCIALSMQKNVNPRVKRSTDPRNDIQGRVDHGYRSRKMARRLDSAFDHNIHEHGHRHDQHTYEPCTYNNLKGHHSQAEHILFEVYSNSSACGNRAPNMAERNMFYNALRTGEMSEDDVKNASNALCTNTKFQIEWSTSMPNRVYAWTTDFHPAPSSCNFNLLRDIGVTLHAEVDNIGYCEFAGVCRKRMKSVFGLGKWGMGYALDPDYKVQIAEFYDVYKDDPEFKRIDTFVCSHPTANCELFAPFGKPLVMFPTTRMEFGRWDLNVPFRTREVRNVNSYGELELRWGELIDFIHKRTRNNSLLLAANSLFGAYDVLFTTFTVFKWSILTLFLYLCLFYLP